MGIGTVEPQLAVDAQEQQLTMDKSISNLPPILHNISFFESRGSLIEANRGIVEIFGHAQTTARVIQIPAIDC